MNRPLRNWIHLLAVVLGLSPAVGQAEFPERSIRIIVPWGAGGTSDLSMRKLASIVSRDVRQPIIIENKPGATGVVGTSELARAPADGYTLALATGATVFIAPNLRPIPFDPVKDLTPILNYSGSYHGIVVPVDASWRTLDELLADARTRSSPLTYATSGTYDGAHFAMLVVGRLKGVKLVNVPFQGGATALTALLGRHVSFAVLAGFSEQVRTGKLRLIALLDGDRMQEFPDVPTLREVGIEWEYPSIMGVVGPAGMPAPVRSRLESAFFKAASTPEFKEYMTSIQMPMRLVDGKRFDEQIRREFARYGKAAAEYGIKQ